MILTAGLLVSGGANEGHETDSGLAVPELQTLDAELRGNVSALRSSETALATTTEEDLDESFLGLRVWTMEPAERAHLWTLRQEGALDEHLAYPRGAIRAEESLDRLAARLAPVVSAAPDAADGGQPVPTPAPPVQAPEVPLDGLEAEGWVTLDDLSFYLCSYDGLPPGYDAGYCGTQADGSVVHPGGVACGYAWALGTRLLIEGDPTVYTCTDRGLGAYRWVDVFFYDYASGRAWRDGIGYGVHRAKVVE